MKRYRYYRGKLREHPEGEWQRYDEVRPVIDRLIDAIRDTGEWDEHADWCASNTVDARDCDCGYSELHAAVEAAETQGDENG